MIDSPDHGQATATGTTPPAHELNGKAPTESVHVSPPASARILEFPAPTCGRIVHVYSSMWEGPRPGVVLRAETQETPGSPPRIRVHVLLDGHDDTSLIEQVSGLPSGATLRYVPLHPALQRDDREIELSRVTGKGGMGFATAIAEWPPRQKEFHRGD